MRCWECETVEMRTKVGETCILDRLEIWGTSGHSYPEPHQPVETLPSLDLMYWTHECALRGLLRKAVRSSLTLSIF